MICRADVDYNVIRTRPSHYSTIKGLQCKYCIFYVSARRTPKPRTSKSGLGRYNRMRGRMVAHLHEFHRDELERD